VLYVSGITDCDDNVQQEADYCMNPSSGLMPLCNTQNIFFQDTPGGGFTGHFDSYISSFDKNFNLTWSSFFGGIVWDEIHAIEKQGDYLYMCGLTTSPSNFPLRNPQNGNYWQANQQGSYDAFVARLTIGGGLTQAFHEQEEVKVPPMVYPNPVRDICYIRLPDIGEWSYELFTVSGSFISSAQTDRIDHYRLDMSSYPAGVYFCRLVSLENGQMFTAKIIKE